MQLHDIEHFQRCISCGKQSRDNRKIFGNIIGNTESCQGTACHQKLFTDLHNFDQFRWIGIKIDHIARFLSRLCTAVHCNAHICLSQCRRIVSTVTCHCYQHSLLLIGTDHFQFRFRRCFSQKIIHTGFGSDCCRCQLVITSDHDRFDAHFPQFTETFFNTAFDDIL